jgi:hypothetical protein
MSAFLNQQVFKRDCMHKWAQHVKENLSWPENNDDIDHNKCTKEIEKTKNDVMKQIVEYIHCLIDYLEEKNLS